MKIVLTGGPCGGKSTIALAITSAFGDRIIMVPESATTLFRGGFPRWPEASCRKALQSAIFRVQTAMEAAHESRYPGIPMVLDRATLDGAAYWPDGLESFLSELGTDYQTELRRYDVVLYLESASKADYEIHQTSNPTRTESHEEASQLSDVVRNIWQAHPRFHVVKNNRTFENKVNEVLGLINALLIPTRSK